MASVATEAAGRDAPGVIIEGAVKWFSHPKGFGFVAGSTGDLFFHRAEVVGGAAAVARLAPGVAVRFAVGANAKGPCAVGVVVEGGGLAGPGSGATRPTAAPPLASMALRAAEAPALHGSSSAGAVREEQRRAGREEEPYDPQSPGADPASLFEAAGSPVLRQLSGETLLAVQTPASRWRAAVGAVVAVGRLGGGGGGSAAAAISGADEEAAEAEGPPIGWLPVELRLAIFAMVDPKTLLITIPQVSQQWRAEVSLHAAHFKVHLDLRWCRWAIPEAAVARLARQFPAARSARFDSVHNLTDAAVEALAEQCPGLGSVDFSYCDNLTDAAVVALAEQCPGLGSVNCSRCRKLTDTAVVALAAQCPGLGSVDF